MGMIPIKTVFEIHMSADGKNICDKCVHIPRLDRLYLVTPQKDYAVIVQSVGRVARTFEGKQQPLVFDYVDSIKSLIKSFKKRCASYRKCGCRIKE